MTPSRLRAKAVLERADWIDRMLASIRALPLATLEEFKADARTPAAAESYLRRALEALLDLGRHILAKGFAESPSEYKEIAEALQRVGVLEKGEAELLRQMAGYRNRMVHFYNEVSTEELYHIARDQLGDVESLVDALLRWIKANPDRIDQAL